MIVAAGQTYLDFRNRTVTVVRVEREGVLVSRASEDDAFAVPELWMVDSRILGATVRIQRGGTQLGLTSSTVTHSAVMMKEIQHG